MLRSSSLFGAAALLAAVSSGQQAPPIFELDAGLRVGLKSEKKSEGFSRLKLYGFERSSGTKFTPAGGIEPTASEQSRKVDSLAFLLQFSRSESSQSGDFADFFTGLNILPKGLREFGLRGTGYFGADKDFKTWVGALGIETQAYALLPSGSRWTNSLIFGLAAQKKENSDATAGDTDGAVGTYRAFLGRVLATAPTTALKDREILSAFLEASPTRQDAIAQLGPNVGLPGSLKGLEEDILVELMAATGVESLKSAYEGTDFGAAPATETRDAEALRLAKQLFLKNSTDASTSADQLASLVPLAELLAKESRLTPVERLIADSWSSDDGYQSALTKYWTSIFPDEKSTSIMKASSVPRSSFYIESSGWYDSAKGVVGDRFKALHTATFDFYPKPGNFDLVIRLRYESGYERAVPGPYINRIGLTAALKF